MITITELILMRIKPALTKIDIRKNSFRNKSTVSTDSRDSSDSSDSIDSNDSTESIVSSTNSDIHDNIGNTFLLVLAIGMVATINWTDMVITVGITVMRDVMDVIITVMTLMVVTMLWLMTVTILSLSCTLPPPVVVTILTVKVTGPWAKVKVKFLALGSAVGETFLKPIECLFSILPSSSFSMLFNSFPSLSLLSSSSSSSSALLL